MEISVNNIYPAPTDEDVNKTYIIEERTGMRIAGPFTCDPYDHLDQENQRVGAKVNALQNIYDVISVAFNELKDSGSAFGNDSVVKLFAANLFKQHNTDCASIIRTIRYGLEEYERLATACHKIDARNEVAVEWIKAGREADRIPFI